jgi:hypothetical protein
MAARMGFVVSKVTLEQISVLYDVRRSQLLW